MSIFTDLAEFRKWRKKAALPSSENMPSRRRLDHTWLPFWRRGDYTLYNSELLFSAVSRISNALSAMPIQLYKGSKAQNSRLNDLIRFAPNPNMTSCSWIKTMEACRDTAGNTYALKVPSETGGLEPDRLDIIDPSRVTPIMNTDSGELWYRIMPEQGGETFYVHNFHVLHIPFISTNGYSGISPVCVLNNTMQYADDIQEFSVKQLDQGVNAAVVLEAPANLGETQRAEMVETFMKTYRETSGNILLLESGVTAKSLNLSPVDASLFEVEKITRSKVAMVYNIPPHLLGDYSDTSFSSQEQQMLEFLMLTMLPIVTAYEQEFDRKLLSADQRKAGYHWEFDMDAILRADASTMAEVNYKGLRSGWVTPDEIRATYGRAPLPGGIGTKALVSQDLATLAYTVNDKPKVMMSVLNRNQQPDE